MPTKEALYQVSEYKAAPNGAPGEFTALVSVFNNIDLVGDRVLPGAFSKSLDQWKQSGDPIPVVWSHAASDPFAHIGYVTSAAETSKGLQVSGKIDTETNAFAKQVHTLLAERRVTGFSFRYDVINEKRAKDGANDLIELSLTEVGPTLKGANPDAQLISAKALLDQAAEQAKIALPVDSLSGRKVYLDADLPGAFEETRDAICEAATTLLNPLNDESIYVYVEATFPTYAIVEVRKQGAADETFQVDWSGDADNITLGTPVPVDLEVTVTPKSAPEGAKAGRRLSKTTEAEMTAIHAHIGVGLDRMKALIGNASEDDGKAAPDAQGVEEPEVDGREPEAKSTDDELLTIKTRIESMRASTRSKT